MEGGVSQGARGISFGRQRFDETDGHARVVGIVGRPEPPPAHGFADGSVGLRGLRQRLERLGTGRRKSRPLL